jgi:UDP-N-acetylmuramoyl-L-alanyl-D-glutamate--2,6-diaminopimelate ligase
MILNEILEGIQILSLTGNTGVNVSGISYDSRKVKSGDIFVAITGEKSDGHDYINEAIKNGAIAILCERPEFRVQNSEISSQKENNSVILADSFKSPAKDKIHSAISFIHVKDSREALAYISNNYFLWPSKALNVIGVTGTNGKTTTAYIIKSILESWGKKVGLIGTIQHMIGDEVYEAVHTTPEAPEFQRLIHKMLITGCTYVVSEISSHSLAQKRADGTTFKSCVFTNLSSEHLDFHKTMENYFMAKERLFSRLLDKKATAVINCDDIWGRKLNSTLRGKVITYGLETGSDIMATEINNSINGLRFKILFQGRKYDVNSPMTGLPNVYNILSAAGAAISMGVPWDAVLYGIKKAGTVRGRFEKVEMGQGFLAVVDYAHTEDALERVIYTARGLTKGKIITVFGCGGDRDRSNIATRLSDFVIITSDNPRSEEPEQIIKEIEAGAVRRNYLNESNRKEAIKRAVMMASDGDIVLIAGKGHEKYQEIEGKRFEFNDREVLEEAIGQLINNS